MTRPPSVQRLRAALKALASPPIVVPHVLADFAGGLEAGSVVAGLLFWCDKGKRTDGFFWKSYGEWWEERRVREHTVRRVTRELAARGLIEIKLMRANGAPTLHYRVTDALVEEVGRFIESEESQNGFFEIKESDSLKSQNPFFESEESITAVTTAGTTVGTAGKGAGRKRRAPRRADPQFALVSESPTGEGDGHDAPPGSAPPPPTPHPAVAVYREIAKRQPTKAQREELTERLAEGYDEATWREVLSTWRGAGWNLSRLDQIIDRYERTRRGELAAPGRARGPSTPPPPSADTAAVTALLAKEAARQKREAEMAAWHAERAAKGGAS